jgi:hypothetical protein
MARAATARKTAPAVEETIVEAPVSEVEQTQDEVVEDEPLTEETDLSGQGADDITTYDIMLDLARTFEPGFALRHPKETENDFYLRMMRILASISDEDYAALSKEAMTWYNEAAKRVNGEISTPIPPCPGYAEIQAAKGAGAPEATPKPKRQLPQALIDANAKKAADRAAAIARGEIPAKPAPKEKVAKGPGIVSTMRRAYIADQNLTAKDLLALVQGMGMTSSMGTASAVVVDTKATLDIARELNLLKA